MADTFVLGRRALRVPFSISVDHGAQGSPMQMKETSDWQYRLTGATAAAVICLAIFTWTWFLSRLTAGI